MQVLVDRLNTVNALLCAADGRRRIMFHPRCKTTIRSFDGQTWKPGTRAPDKSLGLDHPVDAAGYAICAVFGLFGRTEVEYEELRM